MFKKIKHIHFVGIGGVGMSGIAEVLINLGYKVSGSDLKQTPVTERLKNMGGTIYHGHNLGNVQGADVVVISSAVEALNPEVVEAKFKKIPVIPRAEMLAELMRLKYSVTISGTHGKTTTSSMIGLVLTRGGLDPTVVIGGKLANFGSNAKVGKGDYLVAEADESDGSFLKLTPTIAVVTNIDTDHLDYYGNINNTRKAFLEFVNKVPFYGSVILCADDRQIQKIVPDVKRRYITYGIENPADLLARNIVHCTLGAEFDLIYFGRNLGKIKLNVPGIHNVYNSLATIAAAMELELKIEDIKKAFLEFTGVDRRIQVKGEAGGVTVVDDYGHHPTEIKATLSAVKDSWKKRTIAVFQPHRYSRTKLLAKDFGTAFDQADAVVITEIYPAGEKPIKGINAGLILKKIKDSNKSMALEFCPTRQDMVDFLIKTTKPGDLVITLGAGDIWKTGEEFLERLKSPVKI
jgi:UDP-N-acetylmuramate--alanine ligase